MMFIATNLFRFLFFFPFFFFPNYTPSSVKIYTYLSVCSLNIYVKTILCIYIMHVYICVYICGYLYYIMLGTTVGEVNGFPALPESVELLEIPP
jgi:hypothetical protein